MANLYRLMWFAVGALLITVPMIAFAQVTTYPASLNYYALAVIPLSNNYETPGAACTAVNAADSRYGPGIYRDYVGAPYQCNNETYRYPSLGTRLTCPYGGSLSGTNCIDVPPCENGGERDAGTGECVATPEQVCQQAGGFWGVLNTDYFVSEPTCLAAEPRCMEPGGLLSVPENADARCDVVKKECGLDVDQNMPFTGILGGNQCLYAVAENEDQPCPKGTIETYVGGVKLCKTSPIDTTPAQTQDTENAIETHPDGSTTEKQISTKTQRNPDGTIDKTETVTTIEKDAQGNVTGTGTVTTVITGTASGFCEQNPNSSICGGGEKSSYAAQCGQAPSCGGDAIQCAIANHTFELYCAQLVSDEVKSEFQTIKDFEGTGEGQGLDVRTIELQNSINPAQIGGGLGLTDKDFMVFGQTITIPFSKLNLYIQMFGMAVLAIAWLQAFRIVSGVI